MALTRAQDRCIDDEQAIALLEKRIDEQERQQVDAHLDGCDACRELVSALAITSLPEGVDIPDIVLDDMDNEGSLTQPRISIIESGEQTQLFRSDAPPPAHQSAPLERGDMVAHFRVMRLLGRGAMGEVYLARDTLLGRKVALKIIAPDLIGSERALSRFLFEARATARFNHPNIVTIHAVGEYQDRPYVALEHIEGDNLRERAKERRPGSHETLRIAHAIADALAEAHANGILHRDLKPANVVIGRDGRIRVVDFGLAKAVQATEEDVEAGVHRQSSSTWLVGTPRYMAPEQWQASDVSGAADVWALGVIIYELCSGRRPFDAKTTVELLRAVCSDERAPRLASVSSAPVKLSSLVASCLEKEPADRPTARVVADRLREMLYPERAALGDDSPFRGLLPFTERHASLFFGREAETAAFVERLRSQPVVSVMGPSGAGKTSFIQAGVVPLVRDEGWLVLQVRPGPRPFDTLAVRIERGDTGAHQLSVSDSGRLPSLATFETRAARLASSVQQLALDLRELAEAEKTTVLLFIDQLEDLFTLVEDEDVQRQFLRAVLAAADDVDDPVRVVLALRHDFVDRLATLGGASLALQGIVVLKPPDADALRHIVNEPVERAGYSFEDDRLVDQIVSAVQGEPACLPLVQFAAAQLWEGRDKKRQLLLRKTYERMGGVGGALAQHADSVINALSPDARALARALLLRLVTAERTRRVLPRRDALDGLGSPSGTGADEVLTQLTEARLVSVTKLRRGDEPMLELTHASLLTTWHTLASWIDQSADELRVVADLTQAAERWLERGRRREDLVGGEALDAVDRLLARGVQIAEQPRQFLDASRVAGAPPRARRRAQMVALAVVVGAALAVGLYLHARMNARAVAQDAQQQTERTESARAGALIDAARASHRAGDPFAARAQLRAAFELDVALGPRADNAARALWADLEDEPLAVHLSLAHSTRALALHPSEPIVAIGADEGPVRLVDARSGEMRAVGHASGVSALVYAPDGGTLYGAAQGAVRAYDTGSDRAPRTWPGIDGAVTSLAISADGSMLAAAGASLWLLDTAAGKVRARFEGHQGQVVAAGFALSGKVLVSGGVDGSVRVWNAQSGIEERALQTGGEIVSFAAEPDGKRVAASLRDGRLLVWDLSDGAQELDVHVGSVARIAFGPGARIVTAGDDGALAIWDYGAQRRTRRLQAGAAVAQVAFARDGSVVAASGGRDLWLWNTERWQPMSEPHHGAVRAAIIAGDVVASAGDDGRIKLWDLASGALVDTWTGHGAAITALAPAGDGKLASASAEGTIRIWDLTTRKSERTLAGHDGAVNALAHGALGLASAGDDATVRLWSVETGRARALMRSHTAAVTGVALAPSELASASRDGTLRLWSGDGVEGRVLGVDRHAVSCAAFDATGQRLASCGADGVRLWRDEDSTLLEGLPRRATAAAFQPGSDGIAVAGAGGELAIVRDGRATRFVGHHGDVNGVAFDDGGDVAVSAGADGSVRTWDAASGEPRWRALALLPSPPRLLSHRGWTSASDAPLAPPETALAEVLAARARYATQAAPLAPLCMLGSDGNVALWDTVGDRQLAAWNVVGVTQLVGLPNGCAARSSRGVTLYDPRGTHSLALASPVLAMAWIDQRLLVVTRDTVGAYDAEGKVLASHAVDASGAVAVGALEQRIVLAFDDGVLALIEGDAAKRLGQPRAGVPTSLATGPQSTLFVGFADGALVMVNGHDGTVLREQRLHGAVLHLLFEGDTLHAATDLGDPFHWNLKRFTATHCDVMRDIWRDVAVAWEHGHSILRAIPPVHRCRE